MSSKLLISDANILIDMEVGGLLAAMFRLDYEFAVPDILFADELSRHHPNLPGLGLNIMEMSGDCVQRAFGLSARYARTGTSRYDLAALALAMDKDCPLLSGDAKLRQVCQQENWQVFGTLWLVECLFDDGIADLRQIEDTYQRMKAQRRRLPWETVKRQLGNFRDGRR